jgi:hypothetical protein
MTRFRCCVGSLEVRKKLKCVRYDIDMHQLIRWQLEPLAESSALTQPSTVRIEVKGLTRPDIAQRQGHVILNSPLAGFGTLSFRI